MDSVLDRIGTSDSDTSDKDYQRPTKKISLKAVVDALDNSPVKKPPSIHEEESNAASGDHITKIDFGLARDDEPKLITKQMPTLTPAPTLNRNNSNEGSTEAKPLPKIVKKEKFWEYEEIDEKPKEKRKRKLPNELARLQDTEEYMEANNAIKSDSTTSERSKRPPRRAAILARENVNFLHGNVENGLELRGTRKALEKEKEDSFNSSRDSIDSDEEEKPDRSAVDNILANSDLFDADEATQPPRKEKKPPENDDFVTLNLPPKPKKRKSEEQKNKNTSNPPISPRISRENLMNDMFASQSKLTSFKIPKKKRDGDSDKKDSSSVKQKEAESGKSPKDNKIKDKERRKDRENGSSETRRDRERPEKRSPESNVEKSEKRFSEKSTEKSEKSSRKTEKSIEKKIKVDTTIGAQNGQKDEDSGQQRWTQRVIYVRRHFAEWVKTLSEQRKNKLPK